MFTTIVLLIFNLAVFVFLGFSLAMLFQSRKMRKIINGNKQLLDEVEELELQQRGLSDSDEDKKKKFEITLLQKSKLEYIRGRLDLVGELMD